MAERIKSRRKDKGSGGLSYKKRADGLYQGYGYVTGENGKEIKKYAYGKTKAEVKEKVGLIKESEAKKPIFKANEITYKQFATRWLVDNKASRAHRTNESYESLLRLYMFPVLGHMKMNDITQADIQKVLSRAAEKGRAPESQKRIRALLTQTFKNAVTNKIIKDSPVLNLIKIGKQKPVPPFILNELQEVEFKEAIKGHELEVFLTMMYATGMRVSEVVALEWGDINFLDKKININKSAGRTAIISEKGKEPSKILRGYTKTYNSNRIIKVPDYLMLLLEIYRKKYKEKNTHYKTVKVFSTSSGNYMDAHDCRRDMRTLIKKYNLEHEGHIPLNVGFHTFRHTLASKLYYKYNITSKAIATYLGHYSREFTEKVYIKSYAEEQDDLVNCMEKDLEKQIEMPVEIQDQALKEI